MLEIVYKHSEELFIFAKLSRKVVGRIISTLSAKIVQNYVELNYNQHQFGLGILDPSWQILFVRLCFVLEIGYKHSEELFLFAELSRKVVGRIISTISAKIVENNVELNYNQHQFGQWSLDPSPLILFARLCFVAEMFCKHSI